VRARGSNRPGEEQEGREYAPLLLQREKRIVIRSQDMIVAEHLPATKAGSTVADPLTWKRYGRFRCCSGSSLRFVS